MEIHKFVVGPLRTNCYVVITKKECVMIDGGDAKVLKFILDKKLTKILLTHGHGDHLIDVTNIKEKTKAKIYVHEKDNIMLNHPYNLSLGASQGVKADSFLKGKVGDFKVLYTPGHSLGSVCYYNEKEKVLFSGDTIFKNAIGRTDLPHSSSKLMKESLKMLIQLPKDVKVYPGHGSETTIGDEYYYILEVLNYL